MALRMLCAAALCAVAACVLYAAARAVAASTSDSSCSDGVDCITLAANGLEFQCRVAGPVGGKSVIMLHGFPEWAAIYVGLMRDLAQHGYRSVACNQRGYSPGARPEGIENYHYSLLRDDVFAVADAANFSKFHLVGHDHGAALGWYAATSDQGKARLLSYSALSVPHLDAMSAGMVGPSADRAQQVASQYFTVFVLEDSASLSFGLLYNAMGRFNADPGTGAGFASAEDFQRALWWYNGACGALPGDARPAGAGAMALPAVMTASQLFSDGDYSMAAFRSAFATGGTAQGEIPQTSPIGKVGVPTLFVCGSSDAYLLCSRPYALATKDYVAAPYTYLLVDCGHDVLSCPKDQDKVTQGILALLESVEDNNDKAALVA